MNNVKRLLLTVCWGLIYFASAEAIDWPVFPDSATHQLVSTYGQYFAGSFTYYHPGMDILAPAGTPVYAVKSGYVKAVLTTVEDNPYYWRILIGDSAGAQECDAWMYAHLNDYTIAVSEGEWVEEGQYLAELVDYPPGIFVEHLHFVQIRHSGASWHDPLNWQYITNALDVLDGIADFDTPVFETVYGSQMIGFCDNQLWPYYYEGDTLSGEIDIVCHVYDKVNHPTWKVAPYQIEYKIEGDTIIDWRNGVCFTGPLEYPGDVEILYKDDNTCNSEGDLVNMEYYFCVTNSDGDSLIEASDKAHCWHTDDFNNGFVTVSVRASDRAGNSSIVSMDVYVENYHTLNGLVSLSNSPADMSNSIVTLLSDGRIDTTASDGSFSFADVGGGTQLLTIAHHAYQTVDTAIVMNQDRIVETTLEMIYVCGDANSDQESNVADAVFLISYVFKGGPAPSILDAGDANCDGEVNVADAVYLINYIFKGGKAPCAEC